MKHSHLISPFLLAVALPLLSIDLARGQGSLTPPGAPAATMLTLTQLGAKTDQANTKLDALGLTSEKRTPIVSVPVTIGSGGSYYLAASLIGAGAADGITITADNVTIDLNGFTLSGVAGSGKGIVIAANKRNINIRNGTIESWGSDGIDSSSAFYITYEALRLSNNGQNGLNAGAGTLVQNCISTGNVSAGIVIGPSGFVRNCAAIGNGNDGIRVSSSMVDNCTVTQNSPNGISASSGTVTNCRANGNGIGISASSSRVTGCVVTSQDTACIIASGGSDIIDNKCNGNGSGGSVTAISVTGGSNRIEGNRVAGANKGIFITSTANTTVGNITSGCGTNYTVPASNFTGTIVTTEATMNSAANTRSNLSF